eukprot:768316-Hanusia_phi.AAC.6
MKDMRRSPEASDLDPIDIDPEVGEGLQQIRRNDQVLDEHLELVRPRGPREQGEMKGGMFRSEELRGGFEEDKEMCRKVEGSD